MITLAATGSSVSWYLTRSTGAVALLLLTGAVVLGVLDVGRFSTTRWPRFLIDGLHRNVSLLAVVFLVLHVITSVLDGYAPISLTDSIVPFASPYRPFWLGLGAISFDLLLAVTITSMLRRRIGHTTWRTVHWLSYASWPIALVHGLGTGSDAKSTWLQLISAICLLVVIAAVCARALDERARHPGLARAALGGVVAFVVFLVIWIPVGPLGSNWAQRSGTPTSLLAHAGGSSQGGGSR